jgi:hypothetical protein
MEDTRERMYLQHGRFGCATAKRQSNIVLDQSGQDAKYGIQPMADGFEIEIAYSRYQFVPESERVRVSMGRNGLAGMTTCRAHGVAKWKA